MMTQDEKYIRRCIQLAYNGFYSTSPNPMVGAVIVCQGKIIGEGYHIKYGEAHAEVNAIRSVKDESLLKSSTIYVSLEPCSHYGKTPPCADLIIRKGIPRVVVGCIDPFSLVGGRGIQKLREAGIEVTVGVLEKECQALIHRFTTFHLKKRPFVTLKWAQSADGFLDKKRDSGSASILSTPVTSLHVHKLRASHQAILVGRKTALLDNPTLTCRHWQGKNPVRLVIDRNLSLPNKLNLFDQNVTTWVFNALRSEQDQQVEYIQLDFTSHILSGILQTLYERQIQSLLVEGGRELLQSFLDSNVWDEIYIEHSKKILNNGISSPQIPSGKTEEQIYYDHTLLTHFFNQTD